MPSTDKETQMNRPIASAALLTLALTFAPGTVCAQSISTSKGEHALPLTTGYRLPAQYAEATRIAETAARELMADAAASEKAMGASLRETAGLNDEIRREKAEYERAQASFDASNKKYLSDLAAYQQRQTALSADIRRHGEQAEALKRQSEGAAYASEAARLNEWAQQLGSQRGELEAEGQRLLGEHERVEAERARLAAKRAVSEGKLKGQRDQTVQNASGRQDKRTEIYRQLRIVVDYLRQIRNEAGQLNGRPPARSTTLEQAEALLQRFERDKSAK